MGFKEVYDFVESKVEWIVHGLPLEGKGPHYPLAGEAVNADVLSVLPNVSANEVLDRMREEDHDFAVVVNEYNVILGRVRKKNLEPSDQPVFEAMTPGATTVRTVEPLEALVERMTKAGVRTMLVSDKHGHLLGVVDRDEAERFIERKHERLNAIR